jgi:hypothetical protein
MLVLLRDHQTLLYYAGHGRWTARTSSALNFHCVEDALLRNRQEHLEHTEIVVQHSLPSSKVVLPVGKRRWYDPRQTFF